MGKLCTDLKALADYIRSAQNWPSEEISADDILRAESKLEDIIMEESAEPEQDFNDISDIISKVQLAGNTWNREESAAKTDVSTPQTSESSNVELPPGVDEQLLEAFIEQQLAVLPEIEDAILKYEKDERAETLAGLRRIVHTMKGEAGVCGIKDIGILCHQLEDYIDADQGEGGSTTPNISADILLDVKDWLDGYFNSLSRKEAPSVTLESILDKLKYIDAQEGSRKNKDSEVSSEKVATIEESQSEKASEKEEARQTVQSVPINDPDLAKEFIEEANEHLDAIDENLLVLENDPSNMDAVSAVFRAFHTIKGVAGFLGLGAIGDLAHVAETLLDQVRKGVRRFEGSVTEITFRAHDMLRSMIEDLKNALVAGTDFQVDPQLPVLMTALRTILDGSSADQAVSQAAISASPASVEKSAADIDPSARQTKGKNGIKVNQTMRVDTAKIDNLLDTIGELVITESIVVSDPAIRSLKSIHLEKNLSLLDKITRSLQDAGMAMRLVPIDATFRKMERLVRDLCRKSSKKVDLVIEGGDTEIDRSMVEKLGDPLIHMIRNSMDHGIESADERQTLGKKPFGRIVLRAYHKGGNIHIDIEDDGRGLNREAIVAKALEKGVIESGDNMSDQEVYSLIFNAGFSTAKQVTEISGRGVGMDVVRRNMESMRGNVLIKSQPNQGSTFTIVLPLTMAIIDGMLAKVGSEVYIIPTLSIIESFRPTADMVSTVTGRGEVVKFRGNLLPLVRLSRIFGVSGSIDNPTNATIMIIEEKGRQWGLLLDEIIGQQQIVIKSLSAGLGNVPGIAGVSIMADGKPGLILDVAGLIKLATA